MFRPVIYLLSLIFGLTVLVSCAGKETYEPGNLYTGTVKDLGYFSLNTNQNQYLILKIVSVNDEYVCYYVYSNRYPNQPNQVNPNDLKKLNQVDKLLSDENPNGLSYDLASGVAKTVSEFEALKPHLHRVGFAPVTAEELAESKVDIGKRKNPKTMSFFEDDEENDSTPASQTTHETRQSPWQTSADPYAYSQEEGR